MYSYRDYSQWSDSQKADFALFNLNKPTNLDIKDAAYLHVVHILQHPTSRPTTRSTQDTMVNAPKKKLSPDPVRTYVKSTNQSTPQCHQENERKRDFEAECVRALEALWSLWSKMKLSAVKWWDTHCSSNKDEEKSIKDYVDRETVVATKWVEDTETTMMQEQEDMKNAEKAQSTTRKPIKPLEEMLDDIGHSLSDLATSDDEENGADRDDEEHTELGKPSEDDEFGWAMGTIFKMVQHPIGSFQQNHMSLEELMQPGWGNVAGCVCERDMKYGMAKLKVPKVVNPEKDTTAATPSPTTFEELLQTLDMIPEKFRIPHVPSQPRSCQMRLSLG